METVILFAFGAMIFWGLGDFLIQRTIYKVGSLETLFLITFASSFLLLPFTLPYLGAISVRQWLVLAVLGVIGYLGAHIHFIALQKGKLAVVEIILGLELPLTVLFGALFLQERLSLNFIVLMAVVFIGIILVSIDFKQINTRNFLEKGAILALFSSFLVAWINFFTAVAAKELSPLVVISWPWLISCVVSFILLWRQGKLGALFKKTIISWKLIVFMSAVDIFAWLCYASAVADKELSITTAISESFVVIAFFLGVIYNQEKVRLWQIAGALLAVSASIVIAFL